MLFDIFFQNCHDRVNMTKQQDLVNGVISENRQPVQALSYTKQSSHIQSNGDVTNVCMSQPETKTTSQQGKIARKYFSTLIPVKHNITKELWYVTENLILTNTRLRLNVQNVAFTTAQVYCSSKVF